MAGQQPRGVQRSDLHRSALPSSHLSCELVSFPPNYASLTLPVGISAAPCPTTVSAVFLLFCFAFCSSIPDVFGLLYLSFSLIFFPVFPFHPLVLFWRLRLGSATSVLLFVLRFLWDPDCRSFFFLMLFHGASR